MKLTSRILAFPGMGFGDESWQSSPPEGLEGRLTRSRLDMFILFHSLILALFTTILHYFS